MSRKSLLKYLMNKIVPGPAVEMASVETVQKLELRALQAERIINDLKNEVLELKNVADSCKINISTIAKQYADAKLENEKLKSEVNHWKKSLIKLESELHGLQVGSTSPVLCEVSQNTILEPKFSPLVPCNEMKVQERRKREKVKPAKDLAEVNKNSDSTESEGVTVDIGKLDLRIGKIISVKKHPDADSLYVEEIDVGEQKPRTVVSGLVKFIPIHEMQNRMVVLLCNLKPAKMRGVSSEAMVLCASTKETVEVLKPPEGSVPGDRVLIEGYSQKPDSVLNPKKKIFETVAVDLRTNNDKQATYKGIPFSVPGKGFVTTSSLVNAAIK